MHLPTYVHTYLLVKKSFKAVKNHNDRPVFFFFFGGGAAARPLLVLAGMALNAPLPLDSASERRH